MMDANVTDIARIIQLAVAPVFLLTRSERFGIEQPPAARRSPPGSLDRLRMPRPRNRAVKEDLRS
jgi:hypothetical protein